MHAFKLIKRIEIKNCTLDFQKDSCFMYDLPGNGLTEKDLVEAFNGRKLLVYQYVGKHSKNRIRKCPWCKETVKDLITHIDEHNKDIEHYLSFAMQNKLYGLLLSKVKKGHYFATSYCNASCQYCIDPIKEGREGMCSVPESARNKVQSFRTMGFDCDGFEKRWLKKKNISYIIL